MALEYSKEMCTWLIVLSFGQNNKVSGIAAADKHSK